VQHLVRATASTAQQYITRLPSCEHDAFLTDVLARALSDGLWKAVLSVRIVEDNWVHR
jgi:hypothetical protein